MWPPRSPGLRLARTTMAMAFQRIRRRMRHSMAGSPSLLASRCGGMVLTYSVVGWKGSVAPARRVSSAMRSSSWWARSGPSWSSTAFSDSTHSRVSVGSGSFSSTSLSQFMSFPGPRGGASLAGYSSRWSLPHPAPAGPGPGPRAGQVSVRAGMLRAPPVRGRRNVVADTAAKPARRPLPWQRSLRTRLALWSSLASILLLLSVALVFYAALRVVLVQLARDELRSLSEQSARDRNAEGPPGARAQERGSRYRRQARPKAAALAAQPAHPACALVQPGQHPAAAFGRPGVLRGAAGGAGAAGPGRVAQPVRTVRP